MGLTNLDLKAIAGLIKMEFEPVNEKLDRLEGRMDRLEGRMDRLEGCMEKVESEVSALKSGQLAIRQDIKRLDGRVEKVYRFAQEAMAMSMENRTWLETL